MTAANAPRRLGQVQRGRRRQTSDVWDGAPEKRPYLCKPSDPCGHCDVCADVIDPKEAAPPDHAPAKPVTLAEAQATFRKWLGDDYDIDALNATLATAAAERLGGDPLWLLLVSGSGNAKTETVQSVGGAGAEVVSTISSDGALLSGTPNRQRAKDATGGLLRKIGDHGLLVIKDVTSILSMNRDTRATLLAAFRELHDGRWIRYLGGDGGKTLEWSGRLVVIGAVTTAWDRAHDVIASMGDRFLILRMDSSTGRRPAGRQARRNVSHGPRSATTGRSLGAAPTGWPGSGRSGGIRIAAWSKGSTRRCV